MPVPFGGDSAETTSRTTSHSSAPPLRCPSSPRGGSWTNALSVSFGGSRELRTDILPSKSKPMLQPVPVPSSVVNSNLRTPMLKLESKVDYAVQASAPNNTSVNSTTMLKPVSRINYTTHGVNAMPEQSVVVAVNSLSPSLTPSLSLVTTTPAAVHGNESSLHAAVTDVDTEKEQYLRKMKSWHREQILAPLTGSGSGNGRGGYMGSSSFSSPSNLSNAVLTAATTANPAQDEDEEDTGSSVVYETFHDLVMAACQLLEQRFSNLDQDSAGVVWFGNFERFVSQNGCPDTTALRLDFERQDGGGGVLTFRTWLGLCVNASWTDLAFFFNTPRNAHVIAEAVTAIRSGMLRADTRRVFGLSPAQAHAWLLQELPACAAMESLCQTCVQRVLSGRRSGVAHHDETLALEDVVYLLYLVMGHLKGHSLRCSYASEDMSAWPTADWQAVTECFEALEKDFGSFDERGVADGFVDIDAIAKALPLRAKASRVDVFQRFFPLVRQVDGDGGRTLSFFDYTYLAYKMSLGGGYTELCARASSDKTALIKCVMLSIASWFHRSELSLSRGLRLADVAEFFSRYLSTEPPADLPTYFIDVAARRNSPSSGTSHEYEVDTMGFLAVLYYLARTTGPYHVSNGYDAGAPLPHGPGDPRSRLISRPSPVSPQRRGGFLLPQEKDTETPQAKIAAAAALTPLKMPAFEYSAFQPQGRLECGRFSDLYVGQYKGYRICLKSLSNTLVPFSRCAGLARWRRAARLHVDDAHVIKLFKSHLPVATMQTLTSRPGGALESMMVERAYMAFEYCENGRLFDLMYAKGWVPDRETALRWAMEVASGMCAVHAAGLIHRSLASFNILLTADFSVRVACFGDASEARVCRRKVVPGCQLWAAPEVGRISTHPPPSPEQLAKGYTNKADVYSFGIVLWELLHSAFPYERELPGADSQMVLTEVVCQGLRPNVDAQVPKPLEYLMQACWQEDASKRPSFERVLLLLRGVSSGNDSVDC